MKSKIMFCFFWIKFQQETVAFLSSWKFQFIWDVEAYVVGENVFGDT